MTGTIHVSKTVPKQCFSQMDVKRNYNNLKEQPKTDKIHALLNALNSGSNDDVSVAAHEFIVAYKDAAFHEVEVNLVTKLLISLSKYGLVPSVIEEERGIDENDFPNVCDKAVIACKCIKVILNHVEKSQYRHSLVSLMIFCGQHSRTKLWSNSESVQLCEEVLDLLVQSHNCESVPYLLVAEDESLLIKKIFPAIVPSITRTNWKCNPGMKVAFEWLLFNIKHPHVGAVFNEVLPPSLLFVDDFILENRLLGIECLGHILKNTPVAELQWYGRADVIYSALKNLIYHREPQLIVALYPCLLNVLSLIEVDPKKPAQIRKVNQYDVIYQLLLKEMDMEQTIALRRAYSQILHLFPCIMGITMLRHLKATTWILFQYLEVFDGPEETTRLNCLKALQALITVTWPRIANHIPTIVEGLVKLLYDSHDQSRPANKSAVVESSLTCLKLLYKLKPDEINDICKPLLDLVNEIPALATIHEIWAPDLEK